MESAFVYSCVQLKRTAILAQADSTQSKTHPKAEPAQTKRASLRAPEITTQTKHQPRSSAFNVVYNDCSVQGDSQTSTNVDIPFLVFIPGLDSRPLPAKQAQQLSQAYRIVSICHARDDRSGWEELVQAVTPILESLSAKSSHKLTIVGESFGAALAMRLIPSITFTSVERLVLINPGTAIMHDHVLQSVSTLLPLLKIDKTERILYKGAAAFLFNVMLTRSDRLDEGSIPGKEWPFLRSFDIDDVPLDTTIHRVQLLRSFGDSFTDDCIRNLITIPTVLVASGQDLLLRSRAEINRLSKLLTNVEKRVVLEGSGHAALLEREVSLASILEPVRKPEECSKHAALSEKRQQDAFQSAIQQGKRITGPWRSITSPKIFGGPNLKRAVFNMAQQNARQRPVLLVGNHTVFGFLDVPLLFIEVYELLNGIQFRSLAHSAHFEQYGEATGGRWTKFVTDLGAVPANARNYYRFLSNGERILLFPGGAREVCRRRGERYKLFWKEDVDFVRPAAKFDAIIVPFCAVGADDAVDIVIDGQELQKLPILGEYIRKLVVDNKFCPEEVMPIASFPPKGDRFYFKFQRPIDTANIDHRDAEACKTAYENVRNAVEEGIEELLRERDKDPKRRLGVRLFDGLLPTFDF